MLFKLKNWKAVYDSRQLPTSPEGKRIYVMGEIYGREGFKDGEIITTSRIKKSEGKVICTITGSNYLLGEMEEEYKNWCEKNKIKVDEKQPVKIKE